MVRVFETNEEFVLFMCGLPVAIQEVFCTNYLPSSLFPKDTIRLFFERINVEQHYGVIASNLWEYGKRQRQAYLQGKATLCIDQSSLSSLCLSGRVHQASPQFEVSYAVRIHVLRLLQRIANANSLVVTNGPIPFVFKLYPPSGVLIDVNQNVTAQNVQGIWIDDIDAYRSFVKEFGRLKIDSGEGMSGQEPSFLFTRALEVLGFGRPCHWPPN